MSINDVVRACESLAKIGKKPTIALVKTKIAGKIPLALIVKGIQAFQSNSEKLNLVNKTASVEQNVDSTTSKKKQCNCEDRVRSLENEILEMKACITALQAQVKALIEQ